MRGIPERSSCLDIAQYLYYASKRDLLRSKRDLLRSKRDLLRSKRDLLRSKSDPLLLGIPERSSCLDIAPYFGCVKRRLALYTWKKKS
jgi:hypothetical protein